LSWFTSTPYSSVRRPARNESGDHAPPNRKHIPAAIWVPCNSRGIKERLNLQPTLRSNVPNSCAPRVVVHFCKSFHAAQARTRYSRLSEMPVPASTSNRSPLSINCPTTTPPALRKNSIVPQACHLYQHGTLPANLVCEPLALRQVDTARRALDLRPRDRNYRESRSGTLLFARRWSHCRQERTPVRRASFLAHLSPQQARSLSNRHFIHGERAMSA
jgi:hypothetical protein